jgi:hypothetical protein
MGSQDEIRRLMKEAKQKPSAAAAHANSPSIKAKNPAAVKSTSSTSEAPTPAGFYDDSLADAKARKVDVEQLAETQLASEWEAFQEFAAEVEQQSVKEEKEQVEETKEREAIEQLENMQYVDRYRVALERATSLRKGEKQPATGKRKPETSSNDLEDGNGEAEGASAVETALKEHKRKLKKVKKRKHSDDDDSDAFDPCNWRSRGF